MSRYFSEHYQHLSHQALQIAVDSAPAYRWWKSMDKGASVDLDTRYAALPILTKKEMRESFPQGLVPGRRSVVEGLRCGEIEYVQTSGTTEEKVTNLWNQTWWNASERASWKLNAHTKHLTGTQREAQLASALSVGFRSESDLPMHARRLDRFLFLSEKVSALEWTQTHLERMARELEAFQPLVLEANPSLLAHLAWWAFDHGVALYQPPVILFTYEFTSALHVRAIRRVFSSPLVSSYGATETGYVFMECEHGTLHQNTEFCRVDLQPLRPEHGGPGLARLLVTTFHNPWTALVRFDVGDLGRVEDGPECPCGRREGLRLKAIEGRITNATFTRSGELVSTHRVDRTLADVPGVRDYSLVQTQKDEFKVELVLEPGVDANLVRTQVTDALLLLYGHDVRIGLVVKSILEPAPSGKYRRTYAAFDYDVKGLLA
jgi:phenylacetate-CoA ligase